MSRGLGRVERRILGILESQGKSGLRGIDIVTALAGAQPTAAQSVAIRRALVSLYRKDLVRRQFDLWAPLDHEVRATPKEIQRLTLRVNDDLYQYRRAKDQMAKHRLAAGKSLLRLQDAFGQTYEDWWPWFAGRFECTQRQAEQMMQRAKDLMPARRG